MCTPATGLKVGYFAQHQLEQLHGHESPLAHLQHLDPGASEQSLRDFLGGFGFVDDSAVGPVAPLSGGEKARLVLALLTYRGPNLLLLDEPTNHLDLEMRHALTLALQDFPGALVLVSHDRHLLRSVTDELLLVSHGTVKPFEGDLDDYRKWLTESLEPRVQSGERYPDHGAAARRERRRQEAVERQRLQPLRAEVERLEAALEQAGAQKTALEQALADPTLYEQAEKDRLKSLLVEQAQIKRKLDALETAWLAASTTLEAASGEQR